MSHCDHNPKTYCNFCLEALTKERDRYKKALERIADPNDQSVSMMVIAQAALDAQEGKKGTVYVNASVCNEDYDPINPAIVVNLEPPAKEGKGT